MEFINRYVELWNNPDPAVRRAAIEEIWAADAVHAIDIAQWRGHKEIEERVTEAYDEFVRPGQYVFKPAGDAQTHHDATKFTATMVRSATGEIEWTGTVFLLLDETGRVKYDYQFTNQDT